MKKALCIFYDTLHSRGIPFKFVLNVHDEIQVETPAEFGEEVGRIGRHSIQLAGLHFGLRCPLDGEYKVGKNWAEAH